VLGARFAEFVERQQHEDGEESGEDEDEDEDEESNEDDDEFEDDVQEEEEGDAASELQGAELLQSAALDRLEMSASPPPSSEDAAAVLSSRFEDFMAIQEQNEAAAILSGRFADFVATIEGGDEDEDDEDEDENEDEGLADASAVISSRVADFLGKCKEEDAAAVLRARLADFLEDASPDGVFWVGIDEDESLVQAHLMDIVTTHPELDKTVASLVHIYTSWRLLRSVEAMLSSHAQMQVPSLSRHVFSLSLSLPLSLFAFLN
jgi:hypothetical protein